MQMLLHMGIGERSALAQDMECAPASCQHAPRALNSIAPIKSTEHDTEGSRLTPV